MRVILLLLALSGPVMAGQLSNSFATFVGSPSMSLAHANECSGLGSWDTNGSSYTLRGSVAWVTGLFGCAVSITPAAGTSFVGYAVFPSPTLSATKGIWVHSWVKVNSAVTSATWIHFAGSTVFNCQLYIKEATTITIWEAKSGWGSVNTGLVFPVTGWHMLDMVRGGTAAGYYDVYIDAVYKGKWTTSKALSGTDSFINAFWGSNYGVVNGEQMNGYLDDMVIANITIPTLQMGGVLKKIYTEGLGRHSNAR